MDIIGGLVFGYILNSIIGACVKWWNSHQIEVKNDIDRVPGLSTLLHSAIWMAEQFKASKDGNERFKMALAYVTSQIGLLPVPVYVKASLIKVIPQLLQKAFDSLPIPDGIPSQVTPISSAPVVAQKSVNQVNFTTSNMQSQVLD